MITAGVERWSAWAPGQDNREAWRTWAKEPKRLEGQEYPDARFLPALLRRRCNPLARTLLTAAFACCDEDTPAAEPRTVFASRHGSINDSIGMLFNVSQRRPISPALFSHTVHNAQAAA